VLERLTRGPAPVSELAQPFKMALPSFVQHLQVLENCGLVRSKKQGRVRTYTLAPQPLKAAEHWLSVQRSHWDPLGVKFGGREERDIADMLALEDAVLVGACFGPSARLGIIAETCPRF
jgi:DNA-binding transcriptional ArsR family regulator